MAHGCDFFDVDWSDKGIDHLVEVFRKKFIQMEKEKDEIIAQQADRIKQLELEVARLSGSLQSASDSSSDESSKGYNEDNTRSYNVRKFKGYPHVPSPARPRPSYEDSIEFPAYRKLAQISTCPTCGDPLAQTATTYERTSEDVKDGRWAVTCWDVERRYCKKCRRLQTAHCEGVVPDAHFGVVIMARVFCMRCFVIPYEKIQKIIHMLYGKFIEISDIIHMCDAVADASGPVYDELFEAVQHCDIMWGDDTGWYYNKERWWTWGFHTSHIALFHISKCRSKTVAEAVLEAFDGIAIGDSHASWNDVGCECQRCLLHYFRDMYRTLKKNKSPEFMTLFDRLYAVLKSAINMWKKYEKKTSNILAHIIQKLQDRIERIANDTYTDKDCIRYAKRLRREKDQLLTFLRYDGVPFHNNWSENALRIFALMRKICYGSRSIRGIKTTEVIVTIYATCKIRGVDPYKFMIEYLSGKTKTIPLPKSNSVMHACAA